MNIDKSIQLAFGHHRAGNLQQAEFLYRKILKKQPWNSEVLHMLGVICSDCEKYDSAIDYIKRALRLDPNNAHAYYNLGNTFRKKGQQEEAISSFQKAVQLNPLFVDAYYNLGIAFQDNKQFNEAIASYLKASQLDPRLSHVWYNLGNAYRDNKQFGEAITSYLKALELNPSFVESYINLAGAFRDNGQLDEAVSYSEKALRLKPSLPAAYVNLGTALQDKGHLDEAITCYRKALQFNPDLAEAHWNMSLVFLILGDYKEGWKEHMWRWKLKDYMRYGFSQPLWDGFDISGASVLLHDEQGFGDAIQLIRYAPLVAERCSKVIIWCKKELKTLLRNVPGVYGVIGRGEDLPDFDAHCPLLNLPLIFNTTLESIPTKIPYITADSILVRRWRDRIESDSSRLKVGLVWATGEGELSKIKSFPLDAFSEFARVRNVSFYSLQKGTEAEQAKNPPKGMKLIDYMGEIDDFADTAALIENLDLVISADTAAAHLAGALGKPVWTLIPAVPIWQWMLEREDSPWYATMRLFRQHSLGEWNSVITRVSEELAKL